MPRTRPVALALALGLALVAAPGSALAQDDAPADALADAVEVTVATGSMALEMEYLVEGWQDGEVRTLLMTASGVTSLGAERRMSLTADMTDYGLGELEMMVVDGRLYLRGGALGGSVGEGTWVGVDLDSTDPTARELVSTISGTNDASLALYWLLGATRGPATIKTERIGDVLTDRMVVPVDLSEALDHLPAGLRPVLESAIEQVRAIGIEPRFSTDVWVGVDDGLIHRVRYEFVDVPVGVSRIVITYDMHDFGVPVDPQIPDPADVLMLGGETVDA
jgi:hypothetical protein